MSASPPPYSSPNGGNRDGPEQGDTPPPQPAATEHLNIKVTDNASEVFFKIKRTTQLKKLMDAFCERSGQHPTSVRFLFDGQRVQQDDSPETVSLPECLPASRPLISTQLDMADGDTLEVHREQIGG